MFYVLEHFEVSEVCFRKDFDNRDACLSLDLSALPHPYGKSLIRVVMDGVSNGDGDAAVQIAPRSLLYHLGSGLLEKHIDLADRVEHMVTSGADDQEIKNFLETHIYGIIHNALTAANDALKKSQYPRPYCTVSIAIVFFRYIFTANLGDSPIYLMNLDPKNPTLQPIFTCHNAAGEKMHQGSFTEAQALQSNEASKLHLFLGWRDYDLLRDTSYDSALLPQSSILLLGSDGALAQVLRTEMADVISKYHTCGLDTIYQELKSLVEESGSIDDFTLIMDRIESD